MIEFSLRELKMQTISASKLIEDLSENKDFTSKYILNKVIEAISKVGNQEMVIEINSDDDFPVNSQSEYKESFLICNQNYKEVYLNAINEIDFGKNQEENWKLVRFKKDITDNALIEDIELTGHASAGGNQTIEVYIKNAPVEIKIFDLIVDLTK